jgi:GT2 family glycosyltransferase
MKPGESPQVSVIVPCFNGENFLEDALLSVLAQIDPPTFEILVVDDGSNNPSAIQSICVSFRDERIKYLRKENGGVSSALNLGLEAASGRVFTWLSHDDILTRTSLRDRFTKWESLSGENLVFGDWELFGELSKFPGRVRVGHLYRTGKALDAISRGLVNGCTVMTSIKLIREHGGFVENLRATQDYDLWLRLEIQGVRFIHIDSVVAATRQHGSQTSRVSQDVELENQELWKKIVSRVAESSAQTSLKKSLAALRSLEHFLSTSSYLNQFDLRPVLDHLEGKRRNIS